jgi:hypothetical protein
MRDRHVVGLDKRLHAKLPVAGHDLGDMRSLVTVLELECLEVGWQDFEISVERLAILIKVYKKQICPKPDLGLGQAHLVHVDVGEVPCAGDKLKRSIEVPRPAVEGAAQLFSIARFCA